MHALSALTKAKTFANPEEIAKEKEAGEVAIDMEEMESSLSHADLIRLAKNKQSILSRIKLGTEGTIVLVGSLESIDKPISALVRLAEGIIMPNALEVPLPMRFVFILFTPKPSPNLDFHEVGRSFSTLMSNPVRRKKTLKSAILHPFPYFLGLPQRGLPDRGAP